MHYQYRHFYIYQYQHWLENFSYQLLLQGCQGRLEPLLLGPHCVEDVRGCGSASDRLVSVHPQRPVHHLALFVPQQVQLLQPGQGSLQSLPDPAAVYAGGSGAHHPRTRALPAQHGDEGRWGQGTQVTERTALVLFFFFFLDNQLVADSLLRSPLLLLFGVSTTCLNNPELVEDTRLLPQTKRASSSLASHWTPEHLVLILLSSTSPPAEAAQACAEFICITPHGLTSILFCLSPP